MIVTFFLKLGTFFIHYFGILDTLINKLAYVRHFNILCINKLCQIGEDAYVTLQAHLVTFPGGANLTTSPQPTFITFRLYWVIQNVCGQEWQLCMKIYVATVWVG
jgi:hypothetical protein